MDLNSLLNAISGEGPIPKQSELIALSSLNAEEARQFEERIGQVDEGRRIELARGLNELCEDQAELDLEPAMVALAGDESSEVRRLAASSLWESVSANTVRLVLRLAQSDRNLRVREAALISLANYALAYEVGKLRTTLGEELKAALQDMVSDEEEPLLIRRRSLEAIGVFNEQPVRELVKWGFAHHDREVKISAVYAMGRSADDFWLPEVMQALSSTDGEVCFEAARAAGEIELTQAVSRLTELANDEDREVSTSAAFALASIATEEAVLALRQLAGSDDEFLRDLGEEATQALRTTHDPLDLAADMDQ